MSVRPAVRPRTLSAVLPREGSIAVSVPGVIAAQPAEGPEEGRHDVAALIPMVRRIVGARVSDQTLADDVVQETLVRVLGAADRVEPGMLEPYAIVTARNVVASLWKERDRHQRNQHRVVDLRPPPAPDEDLLAGEEHAAITEALSRLSDSERETLLAHEVAGQDTRSLAGETGSTAGAVAAQLNRTRARLRVEYLLALEHTEPPTDRCRPVLMALSSGDRRRQREVDAGRHLLGCALCARLSEPLMQRGQKRDDDVRVPIRTDSDIVSARQAAREQASRLGFSRAALTVIATSVSEMARNIVRFAAPGEIVVSLLEHPRPGLRVVARDTGPGIPDVEQALRDGYSTYHGLGLGLPGARRLMDEFAIVSEPGRGTTVTMTKWQKPEGSL
jgi:RNA polymerase sigma factor (sigma-70 family)